MLEEKEVVEKKKFGIGFVSIFTILLIVVVLTGVVFIMRVWENKN